MVAYTGTKEDIQWFKVSNNFFPGKSIQIFHIGRTKNEHYIRNSIFQIKHILHKNLGLAEQIAYLEETALDKSDTFLTEQIANIVQ